MNYRQLTLQLLSLTLIVTSALMIWKSLCLYTHSESPVVVVLSGSMEPAFKRGDILFLSLKKKEKKTNKRMSFSDNSNSIVGGGGVATTTTKKKKKNEEEEERGEEERTRVGEIIVFSIDGREIPIVHRVIKSHYHPYSTASLSSSSSSSSSQSSFDKADDDSSGSGSIGSGSGSSYDDSGRDDENSLLSSPSPSFKHEMLTKGDNNYMDDIGLYAPGQKWLNEKHVMGRTVGYLPHVGKATILMNDHPMIKYALILVLGLLVISGKEG
jgi:signal peptidase